MLLVLLLALLLALLLLLLFARAFFAVPLLLLLFAPLGTANPLFAEVSSLACFVLCFPATNRFEFFKERVLVVCGMSV